MVRKINSIIAVVLFNIITSIIFADVRLTESNFTILCDWSYDGSKLLFATSKNNNFLNLATISPDGTNERQVTTEEGAELGAFHPDGSIYYWWMDASGTKLMKMNSDGSGKTTLLTIPAGYSVGDWSGSTVTAKVGYVRRDIYTDETTLWIVNLDGTGNTPLTNAYPSGGIDFSPDGQWIVFCSTAGYLYKIKIDNTELTQLTTFYGDSPDWSPDGTKIAFGYKGDIYTINSDGTGLTNLTNDGYTYSDDYPKWSPHGTKILWERGNNLWVMDPNGSNKTQIMNLNTGLLGFLWNKSGDKIAFSNQQNIYIVNPDGSGLKKVTNNLNPLGYMVQYGRQVLCWSGDYQKIVYTCFSIDPIDVNISIMDKDGSNKHKIVSYVFPNHISFTPHKSKLVYENSDGKIYIVNVDGAGNTYLADGETPVWSNDTTRIAYVSGNYPYYLYIMNSDGSNKVQISPCSDHWSFYPNWSPDDKKIVYIYNNDIYIVSTLAPYTPTQVTTDGSNTYERYPVFSPDGTKIAYLVDKYNSQGEELWVINTDGTGATKLVDKVRPYTAIKWAGNNRIYYLKEEEGYVLTGMCSVYSIKPDGTDERKESNIYTDIGVFDVSPTGEVIYGTLNIFSTALAELSTQINIPIGLEGSSVTVTMPKPAEVKIIVGEYPDKPAKLRGTVNPDKGEAVGIVFKPDKKPEDIIGKEYTIKIFTVAGELVEEFKKTPQSADDTWVKWIPKDLASGIYIIYVEGPGVKIHKKVAIVR